MPLYASSVFIPSVPLLETQELILCYYSLVQFVPELKYLKQEVFQKMTGNKRTRQQMRNRDSIDSDTGVPSTPPSNSPRSSPKAVDRAYFEHLTTAMETRISERMESMRRVDREEIEKMRKEDRLELKTFLNKIESTLAKSHASSSKSTSMPNLAAADKENAVPGDPCTSSAANFVFDENIFNPETEIPENRQVHHTWQSTQLGCHRLVAKE